MYEWPVIPLDGILGQHLPVAAIARRLRAGGQHHLARRRPVDDEIEERLGSAQMLIEPDSVMRRAGEDEAAIGGNARDRRQAKIFLTKGRVICLAEARRDQPAIGRVGPPVIRADELGGIAMVLVAHEIGAVPATVVEHADRAIFATHHDGRLQAKLPAHIVAAGGDLAFMPEIHPYLVPDAAYLLLEDCGIIVKPAVNPIRGHQGRDVDVRGRLRDAHGPPLRRSNFCVRISTSGAVQMKAYKRLFKPVKHIVSTSLERTPT